MSVKTALALINRAWEEIENELDANFDPATQVALAWFAQYGFDLRASGELILLANAKNIDSGTLFRSGVFLDGHGKAGLIPRADLPKHWSASVNGGPTVWECVQHGIRALRAEDGRQDAAAALVVRIGSARTMPAPFPTACSRSRRSGTGQLKLWPTTNSPRNGRSWRNAQGALFRALRRRWLRARC